MTRQIETEIRAKLNRATVTIHVEPCHGGCTEECLRDCVLDDDRRHEVRARCGDDSKVVAK
jgi:hypothetical protein